MLCLKFYDHDDNDGLAKSKHFFRFMLNEAMRRIIRRSFQLFMIDETKRQREKKCRILR
jgi:hypothetical protein